MAIGVAPYRWQVAGCFAALALALAVAVAIKRAPADFAALPPVAMVRDRQQRPLWAIRVAAPTHLIAVDALDAPVPPAGRAYQLWLTGPSGARSLGLLPAAGRRVIPEMPALIAGLERGGVLAVTLEPARGSVTGQPSGPTMFRAAFAAAARNE